MLWLLRWMRSVGIGPNIWRDNSNVSGRRGVAKEKEVDIERQATIATPAQAKKILIHTSRERVPGHVIYSGVM